MQKNRNKGFVRFLYTQNPFYLVGTALLLYGLNVGSDSGVTFASQPLIIAGILSGLILLMTITAVAIIKLGGVWDDARTIMLAILLLLVGVVTSCDSLVYSRPAVVWIVLCGGFAFAIAIWESITRILNIWFPVDIKMPFYSLLGLLFFFSLIFNPEYAPFGLEAVSAQWKIYAYGWLVGVAMLMCLPAIAQGKDLFRDTGTPWSWPVYPWAILVILVAASCLRLFFLSLAFVPAQGWGTPLGLHFFLPIVLAGAVLLTEALLDRKDGVAGGFNYWMLLSLIVAWPRSGGEMYQDFLGEMSVSLASPMWLASVLLMAYGVLLWLRGYQAAEFSVTALAILLSFISPEELFFNLTPEAVWPMLILSAMHVVQWSRSRSSGSLVAATVWGNGGLTLLLAQSALGASAGILIGVHLLAFCMLFGGLLFAGRMAVWLRLNSLTLLGLGVIAATITSYLGWIPAYYSIGYVAAVQVIVLMGLFVRRWVLLMRTPFLLMPALAICAASPFRNEVAGVMLSQLGMFGLLAGICFVVGFGISAFKAGWLAGMLRDISRVRQEIQSEMSRQVTAREAF